jgi:hypothetical protein
MPPRKPQAVIGTDRKLQFIERVAAERILQGGSGIRRHQRTPQAAARAQDAGEFSRGRHHASALNCFLNSSRGASMKTCMTIRPPRGVSLSELARVAHEFGREDLAQIFERELNRELQLVGGGVGALAHSLGTMTSLPLEFALKNLLECAAADQSGRSKISRAVKQLKKNITAAHALLIQEVATGKLVKVGQSNFLKQLEGLQVQIEALEDREESRLHTS